MKILTASFAALIASTTFAMAQDSSFSDGAAPVPSETQEVPTETLFDIDPNFSFAQGEDADLRIVERWDPSLGSDVREIVKIYPDGTREVIATSRTGT